MGCLLIAYVTEAQTTVFYIYFKNNITSSLFTNFREFSRMLNFLIPAQDQMWINPSTPSSKFNKYSEVGEVAHLGFVLRTNRVFRSKNLLPMDQEKVAFKPNDILCSSRSTL
jgi:hypothetical protein